MTAPAEGRVSSLIGALKRAADPDGRDLAQRLFMCQLGRQDRAAGHLVGYRMQCRTPACEYCRTIVAKRASKRAAAFAAADNAACYILTIMLARSGDLDAVAEFVLLIRKQLRNLRDRAAKRDSAWRSVTMRGAIEVDAMQPEDVHKLPPQRRAVVEALPGYGAASDLDEVVWVTHAHIAVHAPDLDRATLLHALQQQWPGPGRVNLEPFWSSQSAAANAARIVKYAAKHRMLLKLDGKAACIEQPWPLAVQATYWTWLHKLHRGLAPLRITLDPRREPACSLASNAEPLADPSMCRDAGCWLFSPPPTELQPPRKPADPASLPTSEPPNRKPNWRWAGCW